MALLKKIAFYSSSFSGKAGRREYTIYFLMNMISVATILYLNVNTNLNDETTIYIFYVCLIFLLKLIPMQAAATRRLRHLNINTGLVLITFIPIANLIFEIFLVLKAKKKFN